MLITERDKFEQVLSELKQSTYVVCDTETTGLDSFNQNQIIGISFFIPEGAEADEGASYYIPFRHEVNLPQLEGRRINAPISWLYELAPIFADPRKILIGFNLKFDVNFIEAEGLMVNNMLLDVLIAAHLVNENEMSFKLKSLATKYLGSDSAIAETELVAKLKKMKLKKDSMRCLAPEEVCEYAEQDVILTWRLLRFYTTYLVKQKLHKLWLESSTYLKAAQIMERNGLRIDPLAVEKYLTKAEAEANKLYAQMKTKVGYDFNPGSVPQVRRILGVRDTSRSALLKSKHPIAKLLVEHRMWLKVINTYYKAFLEKRDLNDRLHPNLSLVGSVTGRFACNSPNLQALPTGSKIYKVRDTVIASSGYVLVSFDYSQAELRLLAHYSKDPFLLDVFNNNKDLHTETAKLLGVDRYKAKRINFGIIYGIGAVSLAENLNCSVPEAEKYLTEYHSKILEVVKFYRSIDKLARTQGFIRLWTGRRRHYRKGIDETHKAMSNAIQGGVAEIMRKAISRIHLAIQGTKVRMLLQIHDEILFEIPTEEREQRINQIREIMEDFNFLVPLKVDVKYGPTWGDMKEDRFELTSN